MLRNAAMASSALRRLISSAFRQTTLSPAMTIEIGAVPRCANLQASLSSDNQLFTPVLLSQFRGYARGSRSPATSEDEDDDLSDGEPEFSGTHFDNKYSSEGEEVFDYEYEDEDEDQLE